MEDTIMHRWHAEGGWIVDDETSDELFSACLPLGTASEDAIAEHVVALHNWWLSPTTQRLIKRAQEALEPPVL